MSDSKTDFSTLAIHSGYEPRDQAGSLNVPIYLTSTFAFDSAEQGERRFSGEEEGFLYSRLANPTVKVIEEKIAALEEGEKGLAFGSGMGAMAAALLGLTKAGDHVLASHSLYGGSYGLLMLMKEKYNIAVDFSLMDSNATLEDAIRPETSVICIETPINPTNEQIDLAMVAAFAKKHGLLVVVDNTFASPYLQKPLTLGCDIVVHSATKYLNGHGDLIVGLLAGRADLIEEKILPIRSLLGAIISPFDANLLNRGLKTLAIRMDKHCDNAEYLLTKLTQHPKITQVYYPSLDETGVYQKQMARGGGIISFIYKGTKAETQAFLNRLAFIKIAVSLGDAETLIQHPATMTHAIVPEDARLEMGITDSLVRLSVGLENPADIWLDLAQALDG